MSSLNDRQSALRVPVTEPYATIGHSNALLVALRRRIDELDITYETLEAIAGIQGGYATKILGNPPPKRMQIYTALLLLEALGLEMVIRERPDIVEKYKHRYVKRKMVRPIRTAMRMIELPPDFYRHISRIGGRGENDKKYLRSGDLSLPAIPLTPAGGNTASNGRKLKTRPPLKTWDGKVGLAARRAPFYGSTKS